MKALGANQRTNVAYGNPIIGDIEQGKALRRHRDQLRKMQCSIDNRPPAPMPHLQLFGRDYFARKRATTEAAFQDLKMIQAIARTMTRPIEAPRGLPSGSIKSLNHSARKKELFRITMENHLLLERLERTQPVMNNQRLDEESAARRLHMINCSYSARRNGWYDDVLRHRTHKAKPPMGARSSPALPAIEEAEGGGGADAEPRQIEAAKPDPVPTRASTGPAEAEDEEVADDPQYEEEAFEDDD
ncbi:unnamed protein product [Amoebophrya sp. A25]|nr:unnamed protein product [Amoebophrya sp. A25]|eukprot:GSA25T00020569001.1